MVTVAMVDNRVRIHLFIEAHIRENRYAPTVREVAQGCQLALSVVQYHLDRLEAEGMLRRNPRTARSIVLLSAPSTQVGEP